MKKHPENPEGPTITGCDFICNVATGTTGCGGGCYHLGILTTSTLTSNVAMRAGGGVFGGSVMSNCAVVDNIAGVENYANANGGGADTGALVRNCVFARNRLIGTAGNTGGGGIFPRTGARIYDCIIDENSSTQYGGGLWIKNSNVEIRNCLIRNNVTVGSYHGGGVAVWFAPPGNVTISSCTIVSNYSCTQGGGLYVGGNQFGVPLVENSILYFNGAVGVNSNYMFNISPATVFTNCCLSPALPIGITNVNTLTNSPQFIDLLAGDYRLTRASPCVNSGVIRSWMADANDLDGRARLDRFSGLVDVGCYEYLPVGMFINAR